MLQITRDNQDSVPFIIFRQPKIYIFIRCYWQSAFVIYPTIQYPGKTDPDLHHDVAVHPKSHSLLVRPLGLTASDMHSIGEIHINPYKDPSNPSLAPSFSSAPPPAIEISTPGEIIVRVSSSSDLPRPWQLLGDSSRLHLFPLSGPLAFPPRGYGFISGSVLSTFSKLGLTFLPLTAHFATGFA